MDANKDESQRCIEYALTFIKDDKKKALKLLYKAQKLYHTEQAAILILLLQMSDDDPSNDEGPPSFSSEAGPSTTRRRHGPEVVRQNYTQEEMEAVQRIQSCKTHYKVLGVTKKAGESEIKRQYHRMALKIHPDKNKAPGADEAFKALGKAMEVLGDPQKRKEYDAVQAANKEPTRTKKASTPQKPKRKRSTSRERVYKRPSPPETPPPRNYQTYSHKSAAQEPDVGSMKKIIMVFVCCLVIFALICYVLHLQDPVFSLTMTGNHIYQRRTSNLRVKYFVKASFNPLQSSVHLIDKRVEERYELNLQNECINQRATKNLKMSEADLRMDHKRFENAKKLQTPACDLLRRQKLPVPI